MSSPSSSSVLLHCGGRTLDLSRPVVMGVLNVTPDSFSDGGRFFSPAAAVEQGMRMAAEGAAFIDVGGESTRPGADSVSEAEELRRVLPVIERLRAATDVVISIDTSKPAVIRAAADAGAGLVNDVRALREPGALEAAATSGCAVCLMHMQGEPHTMQLAPHYQDVVGEVRSFLADRAAACRKGGIEAGRLVVDPGFGFGKNTGHNLTLLTRLAELVADGLPVLVGLSRKSMLGTLTGRQPGERVAGSVALAVIAALNGARIVRAHDVAPTVDALKLVGAVEGARGT
jgi:dihydropteroate synthase